MSGFVERAGLRLLQRMEPERAHHAALTLLKLGLARVPVCSGNPCLATEIAGLRLSNPVGLAAGFDKDATALRPLLRSGFGFVEIGGVTPRPQPGNPRPRVFRLTEDRAIINRFGFNSAGMDVVAERLARRPKRGILGINLGANKDSVDRAADYGLVLSRCGAHVDFATVNVSSPNTERLRDLQGADALSAVLDVAQAANAGLARPVPLFIKIAPDLGPAELDVIVRVVEAADLSGIIATNTTTERPALRSAARAELGGLSGAPLRARATETIASLRARTALPLIGVGGIASAEDALARLRAGANAVQLYTALVFSGLGLVRRILAGLEDELSARRSQSVGLKT
ncbi:MAG: quinone-dependent dihydroorotate dehydrogenase [Pseudomonadota bacterium]